MYVIYAIHDASKALALATYAYTHIVRVHGDEPTNAVLWGVIHAFRLLPFALAMRNERSGFTAMILYRRLYFWFRLMLTVVGISTAILAQHTCSTTHRI